MLAYCSAFKVPVVPSGAVNLTKDCVVAKVSSKSKIVIPRVTSEANLLFDIDLAKILGDLNRIHIDGKELYIRPEKIKIVDKSKHKIKVEKTSFIGKEYKIKGTLNKDEIHFYNSAPIKDTNNLFIDFNKSDLLEFDRRCSNFFT